MCRLMFGDQEVGENGDAVNYFRSIYEDVEAEFCGCSYNSEFNRKGGKNSRPWVKVMMLARYSSLQRGM